MVDGGGSKGDFDLAGPVAFGAGTADRHRVTPHAGSAQQHQTPQSRRYFTGASHGCNFGVDQGAVREDDEYEVVRVKTSPSSSFSSASDAAVLLLRSLEVYLSLY